MIPVIGFAGYSNSGKTMVVSQVIKILTNRGYHVAAIKHASHGYDVDVPGKDSWQHYQAGAEKSIVVGTDSYTIHQRCSQTPKLHDILSSISGVDLIILEGFKTEPVPKIEVIREENNAGFLDPDEQLLGVVSDFPIELNIPVFTFEELESLVDFLLETFMQ
ncbi:MAG: molybdopterin-guanine dinucleotide biosynthesis protein B [Syntrophomonas sp.]